MLFISENRVIKRRFRSFFMYKESLNLIHQILAGCKIKWTDLLNFQRKVFGLSCRKDEIILALKLSGNMSTLNKKLLDRNAD